MNRIHDKIPLQELIVLLLYFVLISLLFLPFLSSMAEASVGLGTPDMYIHFWDFWWGRKSLLDLHSSYFFSDYIAYPPGTSLWRSNSGFLLSYFTVPIQSVFQNQYLTYNLTILFSLLINSMCGYALGLKLFKDRYVAFAVGLLMSVNPLVFAQIMFGFLEFINFGFGLLYVLYTIKLLEKRDLRSALLSGIWYCVAASWCWYMGYLLALFTLLLVAFRLKDLIIHRRQALVPLALWLGLLGLFNGVVYVHISGSGDRKVAQRQLETQLFEDDAHENFVVSEERSELLSIEHQEEGAEAPRRTVLGWMDLKFRNSVDAWFLLNRAGDWHQRHINFSFWFLLLLLSTLAWKAVDRNKALFVTSGVLFFLLSLGPCLLIRGEAHFGTRWFMPYSLLSTFVPGMGRVQFPVRFLFISAISLVILGGYGLRRIFERRQYGARGKAALISLISLMSIVTLHAQYDFDIPETHCAVPEFYERIAEDTEDYAILEVPLSRSLRIGDLPGNFTYSFLQTVHNKRRMAAHIPAFLERRNYPDEIRHNALLDALEMLGGGPFTVPPASMETLREGAEALRRHHFMYIIVHECAVPPENREALRHLLGAVFGQPEEDDTTRDRLRIYEVR